jgi:hypothetical protein
VLAVLRLLCGKRADCIVLAFCVSPATGWLPPVQPCGAADDLSCVLGLCAAHTCFNQLDLIEYKTKEALRLVAPADIVSPALRCPPCMAVCCCVK